MKNTKLIALGALLATVPPAQAQTYSIPWHIIGPGGTSTGGIYSVRGSVGQWDAGRMSGGNLSLDGGFWPVATAIASGTPPLSKYDFVDLGVGGEAFSVASAVNNSGQIVGWTGYNPAFWTNNSSPPVPLQSRSDGGYSLLTAINDAGQIVGYHTDTNQFRHASYWANSGSAEQDLGNFGPADMELESVAWGINSSGQIVGNAEGYFNQGNDTFSYYGAAYWTNASGPPSELFGFSGQYSGGVDRSLAVARAINDSGQVVGYEPSTNSSLPLPELWPNASVVGVELGGIGSALVFGINASGQMVGWDFDGEALYWTNSLGSAVRLGLPPGTTGYAQGINASGQMVGWLVTSNGYFRAALWLDSATTALDLNSCIPTNSNFILNQAYGINDSGEIVGYGRLNGVIHAFALTPSAPASSASLRIVSLLRSGGDLQLSFTSQLGHTYNVLSTTDLVSGAWSPLQTGLAGNGVIVQTTIPHPFDQPRQFFRIQQAP